MARRLNACARALVLLTAVAALAWPGPGVAHDIVPNLRAYAPFAIQIGSTDRYFPDGTGAIRFGARVGNLGPVPFDVVGVPQPATQSIVAMQCVEWTGDACAGRRPVGTYVWHGQHASHWHVPDLFAFELRMLRPDRSADLSDAGLVASGARSYVCAADSERLVLADPQPTTYHVCTSLRQGISPTWAYAVQPHADEQFISLDAVPDGEYALVVRVDPHRRFIESTVADNVGVRRIRIGDGGRSVEVTG